MAGRTTFAPRSRQQLIARLRELGFQVENQQEAVTALSGAVVALVEEVDALRARVQALESRQPSQFVR